MDQLSIALLPRTLALNTKGHGELKTSLQTHLYPLLLIMVIHSPLAGAEDFTYTTNNGTITITGYAGAGVAFQWNTNMTEVKIANSVTNNWKRRILSMHQPDQHHFGQIISLPLGLTLSQPATSLASQFPEPLPMFRIMLLMSASK